MTFEGNAYMTLTPDERVIEANRTASRLAQDTSSGFTETEINFIAQMSDAMQVSVKQLLWLRRINEKY